MRTRCWVALVGAVTLSPAGPFGPVAVPSLAGQTVTVSGVGNIATLTWSKVAGANSFSVARRQLVVNQTGAIQSATAYLVVATVKALSYSDLLPTPSVFFEYQVSALSSSGQVSSGAPVRYLAPSFTTVTTLAVSGTATRADLTWSAAYGVTGYHVWRRIIQHDGSIGGVGRLTAQPLSAPGFTDPTVVATEVYEFQVVSLTADGSTWPSVWARYAAPPPPVAPVLVLGGAADRVILSWTSTAGAVGYHIFRYALDQTGRRTAGGQITTTPIPAGGYVDGLPAPALYDYLVTAVFPDGTGLPSQSVPYGAPAFTLPTGVTAAAVSMRGVVAWTPALAVAGYQVWRRTVDLVGKMSNPIQVAGVSATTATWLDGLPDPTSLIEYQVIAVSADGRTWPSAWVRAIAAGR